MGGREGRHYGSADHRGRGAVTPPPRPPARTPPCGLASLRRTSTVGARFCWLCPSASADQPPASSAAGGGGASQLNSRCRMDSTKRTSTGWPWTCGT
jgi:hypothetical protein